MCRFCCSKQGLEIIYTRVNIIRSLNTINFESAETENVPFQFIYVQSRHVSAQNPSDRFIHCFQKRANREH